MELWIGTIEGNNISIDHQLSKSDVECFTQFSDQLFPYRKGLRLFKLVELNLRDFMEFENNKVQTFARNVLHDFKSEDLFNVEANKYFLNFLSSALIFINHSQTDIKRQFGKNSRQLSLFDAHLSKLYDENFSYRFLYKMRNYSQHVGIPIHVANFDYKRNEAEKKHDFKIQYICHPKRLLNEFQKWGSAVTKDLKAREDAINLSPLIMDFFSLLKSIFSLKMKLLAVELEPAISYLDNLGSKYKTSENEVAIFWNVYFDNASVKSYECKPFPFDIIQAFKR